MQSRVGTERSVAFALTNTALAIAPAATIVAPTAKPHEAVCHRLWTESQSDRAPRRQDAGSDSAWR